jgi:GNAT superfamily N-acetyltransferase
MEARERLTVHIEVESSPSEDVQHLIDEGLDIFNTERAGPDDAKDLWVIARGNGGDICGGLKGRTFYSWLFIDWLWVSPLARGHGIGSLLITKAEDIARERGCLGAYVDTFSFQAPDFYRRKGYEEFGRIEGLPPGHACIWLKKIF